MQSRATVARAVASLLLLLQQHPPKFHGVSAFTAVVGTRRALPAPHMPPQQQHVSSGRSLCASRSEPPPEFTIVGDDDDDDDDGTPQDYNVVGDTSTSHPQRMIFVDKTELEDGPTQRKRKPPSRVQSMRSSRRRMQVENMAGTSWMQKNQKFVAPGDIVRQSAPRPRGYNPNNNNNSSSSNDRKHRGRTTDGRRASDSTDTFRTTRVFVQDIPDGTSWQDLKDHFRDSMPACQVVFASVSIDPVTGQSKGHGIVQFETPDMAQTAIKEMRNHPLRGSTLYVREDVQEVRSGPALPTAFRENYGDASSRRNRPPQKWKCANEENAAYLSEEEANAIESRIRARDAARRKKDFDVSDRIREELKYDYGVFIDDRLKLWWTAIDGGRSVPQSIHDANGDGRWKARKTEWRQIPTTPENDANVDSTLVESLLKQRDAARFKKDFAKADELLEQARTAPDNGLTLRIHDESRTWRIWSEAPPSWKSKQRRNDDHSDTSDSSNQERALRAAAQQCIDIVQANEPEKVDEMKKILAKFPGREFNILKRVKRQYLQS